MDFINDPLCGGNREIIQNLDGSIIERITYPEGGVEHRIIRRPYDISVEPVRNEDGFLIPPKPPEWRTYSTAEQFATQRTWSIKDYADLQKKFYEESEEYKDVEVVRRQSHNRGEHIVACFNEKDLSTENVLKTLSAIKGKLMIDVAPIHLKKIECSITPQVRKNIVAASKRLKMYGKKRPIIARFDEYGNRLPDEIDIGTSGGITLKIIDPKEHGDFYIELKGVEFPKIDYSTADWDSTYISEDDLPF